MRGIATRRGAPHRVPTDGRINAKFAVRATTRARTARGPEGVPGPWVWTWGLTAAFPLMGVGKLWGCAEECAVADRPDVVVDGEDRFSTNTMAEEIADEVCVEKGVSCTGQDVGEDVKGINVDKGDGALKGSSGDDGLAVEDLPVATVVLKDDGLAGTRCSERVKVKCAGAWGNVLVRADWLEYDPNRRAASAPNVPQMSKLERRSAENVECIGGLRSPWRAVRRVAGRVVRSVLEEQFIVDPSLLIVVDFHGPGLTKEAAKEKWLEDKAKHMSDLLLTAFGGRRTAKDEGIENPWDADEAFRNLSGDPEVYLASWMRKGCPAGVASTIPACGTFPGTDGARAELEGGRDIGDDLMQNEPGQNYEAARWFQSWHASSRKGMTGARRSGCNSHVDVASAERVVLPRMKDLVDLANNLQHGEDFEDAFHTVSVEPSE